VAHIRTTTNAGARVPHVSLLRHGFAGCPTYHNSPSQPHLEPPQLCHPERSLSRSWREAQPKDPDAARLTHTLNPFSTPNHSAVASVAESSKHLHHRQHPRGPSATLRYAHPYLQPLSTPIPRARRLWPKATSTSTTACTLGVLRLRCAPLRMTVLWDATCRRLEPPQLCHPERSLSRSLREAQSKDPDAARLTHTLNPFSTPNPAHDIRGRKHQAPSPPPAPSGSFGYASR
jgi:hypothetical protein